MDVDDVKQPNTSERFPLPLAIPGAIAAMLVFLRTRGYGMLGYDTYPILVSSRIDSWSDFTGTFTEPLMDGRFTGLFYRPLLNLSFALDNWIWGMDAVGYQLTNALLFGAGGFTVALLARRVAGPAVRCAPWVAALVFLTHPLAIEVLPVPARRPELLCVLFLTAALARIPRSPAERTIRRGLEVGLFTLLAIASKETGLLAPGLAFALSFLSPQAAAFFVRAKRAILDALPCLAVALLMIAARWPVLGGLGGHPETGSSVPLGGLIEALHAIVRSLAAPTGAIPATATTILLGVGLAGCVVAAVMTRRRGHTAALRLTSFGALWILSMWIVFAGAGRIAPWYLLIPSVGWALLLAAAAAIAETALSSRALAIRAVAGIAAMALTVLLAWQAFFSPCLRGYPEWSLATEAHETFLGELATKINASGDGSAIEAPPLPRWVQPANDGARLSGGAILTDYSVQAWADLVYEERNVQVRFARPQDSAVVRPEPGNVLVLLTTARPGFEGPGRQR